MLEHRKPSAVSRCLSRQRDFHSRGHWRRSRTTIAAVYGGELLARAGRRTGGSTSGSVGVGSFGFFHGVQFFLGWSDSFVLTCFSWYIGVLTCVPCDC